MIANQPALRKQFPILGTGTYLCSHSLGAVPASAQDALKEYYQAWATLGIQAWEGPWWAAVTGFCQDLEALLGAPADSVVPVQNATRGIAAISSCLDYSGPRRKVVMTDLEFTTFYPFWRGQQRRGAELVIVPSKDGITVPADDVGRAVDKKTLLVTTCHAYFRSGAVQDLKSIVKAAHQAGAWVLGDGYQTLGTHPVDVKGMDIDFYVGGSHKYLCGGAGAGYLYVRPDHAKTLTPGLTGWFGLENPFGYVKDLSGANLSPGVFRFLDGTPNVPALYSAREGIRAVRRVGIPNIRDHSLELTRHAMKRADEAGLQVRTPRKDSERSGMVCLQFPGSQDATRALVEKKFIVDWRAECGLRMSPHFYNTRDEVDAFFDTLSGIWGPAARIKPRAA